jgi:hypothetical protein
MEMTKTKNVELWVHTTCGIEFEIINVETKKSLSGGRVFWCSDEDLEEDEDLESRGWEYFRKKIEEKGWTLCEEVWS